MKYFVTFFILQLLHSPMFAHGQPSQGGNLEDLIQEIFTPFPNQNGNIEHTSSFPPPLPPNQGHDNGVDIGPGIGTGDRDGSVIPNYPIQPIPTPSTPELNPCQVGECVQYYLCANGSIITDGEGLLDIRFGGDDNPNKEFHPCKGLFETCCTLRSEKPIIPPVHRQEGCGFRNTEGVGFRITGGKDNEAQFAEFPWMVAVLKEEEALQQLVNVFQCGGSLIHPSVVVTAAHCVYGKNPDLLKIRVGEWDTQTKDEIFAHQDREVAEIVVHQHYYKGGLFNDIALLFLRNPVQLAENVNTICLPPQDFNFDGSRCFASGWGKDSFGKAGKYQVILKKIELPIVPRSYCLDALQHTRLGMHFQLHASFICAGGEKGKDTCKGDGGSPLVCPIPGTVNRYYQAGIVSWGIGCGDITPGVYVNVPLFRNWIDEQMSFKRLENIYYNYV